MTAIRHWLATLSVFAFGGMTHSYIDTADAKIVSSAEIERACEIALRANTIDALENFLHKYPPGKYQNDIACYALALDALGSFSDRDGSNNGGHETNTPEHPGGGGGYGQ